MTNSIDVILEKLLPHLETPLRKARSVYDRQATEIILRAYRPLCVVIGRRSLYVTHQGVLTDSPTANDAVIVSQKDVDNTVMRLCGYSLYAYQNEINSGYITIGSGVRVGLCGSAVMKHGEVVNIRDIGTLSFRIAREAIGCAEELLGKIDPRNGVLICGEPGSGKTTLIRDAARLLSYRYRVSLLDERGELAAGYHGGIGFDIGMCDLYSGFVKGDAAIRAIRSMNPELIVCDELGERSDAELLMHAMRCGTAFVASVHAASLDDLHSRTITAEILATGAFKTIVFLGGKANAGRIDRIVEWSDADA